RAAGLVPRASTDRRGIWSATWQRSLRRQRRLAGWARLWPLRGPRGLNTTATSAVQLLLSARTARTAMRRAIGTATGTIPLAMIPAAQLIHTAISAGSRASLVAPLRSRHL